MPATKKVGHCLAITLLVLFGCSHAPQDTRGARLGVLTCHSIDGTRVNVLITSSVDVECTFGQADRYVGQTGMQLGLDLNWTLNQTFHFSVMSAYASASPGFLAGRYVGAKASVTIGVGAGVGVLAGGGGQNISLTPFGIEVSTGAGLAGGIAFLTLEPATDAAASSGS